ncbi:hypothetical protein HMPREF9582_02084 [Cutibacterium acnes HL060PA1]|nr:hypothetical protein HMPREF9582_02084 [Cutibacterium acnes HL060PA1]
MVNMNPVRRSTQCSPSARGGNKGWVVAQPVTGSRNARVP